MSEDPTQSMLHLFVEDSYFCLVLPFKNPVIEQKKVLLDGSLLELEENLKNEVFSNFDVGATYLYKLSFFDPISLPPTQGSLKLAQKIGNASWVFEFL
jgi:hypothetical protein